MGFFFDIHAPSMVRRAGSRCMHHPLSGAPLKEFKPLV